MSQVGTYEERAGRTFGALARYDVEGVMANWAEDSVYDNPMVGDPAHGKGKVREQMTELVGLLKGASEHLSIDRVTEGQSRAIVEWHIEPGDDRRGVHVMEFDDEGLIRSVRVYPRS